MDTNADFTIPCITVDAHFVSIFSETKYPVKIRGGMDLTDRVAAQNLRLRASAPGYQTNFHVAGDPTLIIIQKGVLRLSLRDGSYQDFKSGDAFIAKDYLPKTIPFDGARHGHRAAVIGGEQLFAVHIKLESLT